MGNRGSMKCGSGRKNETSLPKILKQKPQVDDVSDIKTKLNECHEECGKDTELESMSLQDHNSIDNLHHINGEGDAIAVNQNGEGDIIAVKQESPGTSKCHRQNSIGGVKSGQRSVPELVNVDTTLLVKNEENTSENHSCETLCKKIKFAENVLQNDQCHLKDLSLVMSTGKIVQTTTAERPLHAHNEVSSHIICDGMNPNNVKPGDNSNMRNSIALENKEISLSEHRKEIPGNVGSNKTEEASKIAEHKMLEIMEDFKPDCIDWTPGLVKLTKMIRDPSDEKVSESLQLLVKLKFIKLFETYLESNNITSGEFLFTDNGVKKYWPTLKRFLTIIWIACDQSVNFCQQVLTSSVFRFFINNLKILANKSYQCEKVKLFTVKACLGIVHNMSRHLPNSKWRLRNEGLVSTVQPFLNSDVPIVRLKTLTILSYILSEAENEMINSNDDNFIFIFEVLSDALGSADHRSKKFGLSAAEILKGVNNLAINDENKLRIVRNGALGLYEEILWKGCPEEIKLTITTLWSLAFHHYNKNKMRELPGIMEKLCELQHHCDEEICHAARGTYWELENTSYTSIGHSFSSSLSADKDPGQPHIMISYQWDCQGIMLKVKDRLRATGYKVWMDVEHMTGSTLEAMALAVEKAAVVLVCMSQKYKDSPNCRTEAEYVYRLRKDFIPLRLQHEYVPDGWLGILVGTRLYFDIYTEDLLAAQIPRLVRELRDRGKISPILESPDNDTGPIVPKRLTSREAVPVLHSASSPDISHWASNDVKYWLDCHSLTEHQHVFEAIDGPLLLELGKIQSSAPEHFYHMLREDFHLPLVAALKFSWALRRL